MTVFAEIASSVASPNVAQVVTLPARRAHGRCVEFAIVYHGAVMSRQSREQMRDTLQSIRASGCLVRAAKREG